MDNKFFTFLKPAIAYVDNGSFFREPFKWLYMLFAGLSLFLPLFLLYKIIDGNVFDFLTGKYIFVVILAWLIIAFFGWLGFQLWWDRKDKVITTSGESDEFVATPVFAHFIQTFGEWLGLFIGVVGFLISILVLLILGEEGAFVMERVGFDFVASGLIQALLMPVYGFLIIVTTRFVAEQAKALATIANNTRK